MVDTQQVRDEFVARLNEALDGVPGVRKVRGRNVDMHRLLTEMGLSKSTQATHKWLNAEAMPEKENMRLLAALCGVRAEWLEYGEGPKYAADRDDKEEKESNVIAADFSSKKTGMVDIPRLNVAGSMGTGLSRPEDYEDVIDRMRVSTGWLRRNVNATAPSNLAVITGYGDSMEGTFSDGDLLLVDRGITEIKIDAVYVLSLKGELYIKRLQRRPDGVLLMLSDNEKYKPYEIKNGELEQFEVLGRVLLAWNAKRL